ncbi:divergent protein kinase domain 1C [Episyrphus balteatus]|uniref:divergent protein kinase domain 1C n=1 Tax=Episyrphus balteatus TaxID=286459 RepID=UPI00248636DC|nr:divergent protein kinase domain 1C [Episyrphus balteatus]XP_055847183.1 divergent protein kinase domain 1C [Episyrphus balteatus]XP_055847184.1 divergent protein kinase domain 1C [Episyrphus balteatus]
MLSALNAVRRKFRFHYKRLILVPLLFVTILVVASYVDLEICYRLLWHGGLNKMCTKFRNKDYSGSLCDELCTVGNFNNFRCPPNDIKTTVFIAVKNVDVYAIKLAKNIPNDLSWKDSKGVHKYPHIDVFQRMVRMHITLSYNVSLDESMISALLSQEIDAQNPEQMESFWRLFKDNNYMMGKLYEEDSVFPTVLGSCGPYYATEHLDSIKPETSLKYYITIDWAARLKFAMQIMDFLYRLESVKPEPIRLCKIEPELFGMTADKRIKYQTARYAYSETQIDKILSGGEQCSRDEDCKHEDCLGKCNLDTKVCNGIQQNNNLQIVCSKIFKGSRFFPGIFSTSRAPATLKSLVNLCSNPSLSSNNHWPHRQLAPTHDISIRIYNEIRKIYTELTFAH